MAQAPRDENRVPAVIATSNADGTTPLPVYVDSSTNRLLVSGVGGGGTSSTDDSAFTAGSGSGTPIMGFATSDTVDSGDVGVVAMDTSRNLKVNVAAGSLTVDSEFPAAAALSDNFANPTTTNVAAMAMVWDGSAWDRAPGDSTNGILVNLGSNNDVTNTTLSVVGGGAEATALRVTLANDSTGVVTVDGGAGGIEVIQDTAADLNVTEASAADSLTALQLIDNVVAVLGTATYSEGSTSGNVVGAVRNDTLAALVDTDNEIAPLQVNASGALYVEVSSAIPAGDNNIGNVDLVTLPSGNLGQQAMASSLSVVPASNITDATYIGDIKFGEALPTGSNAIGKLAANSGVDIGDVDVTSIVPGVGATNLGKREDDAHSSLDTGVAVWAIRDDDPVAATSGTAGDYEPFHTDGRGVLWTRSVPDTTDLANASGEWVNKYYTAATPTDGVIWSPAAGKRWYVTDIYINTSAASTITLEDDKTGGDAVVWKGEIAANSGWSHSFKTPLYSGEDAADLIITSSAGTVYVTVTGYEI